MGIVEFSTEKYIFTTSRALKVSDLHSTRIQSPPVFEAVDLELFGLEEYREYFCVSVADHIKTQMTDILFVGAGERISAFHINPYKKLWLDTADTGFWFWARFGEYVVMSAELELAAWRITGEKLWTRFVEPPWDYDVVDGQVNLDIMGDKTTFSLEKGPL
ncbi:hypothetical protein ANRL2_00637 [Anaerolineae bacterium]|nr:hypothetical protein ANRL2_00637 [Anaerolineae bacterium]